MASPQQTVSSPERAAAPSAEQEVPIEIQSHETPLEADIVAGDDDGDSAIDSQSLLSTESLTSSILEYRQLHGRTYANAKTGDYWGPNDERQSEGLDLIHSALTVLLDGKLFVAPINKDDPGRVLDIGTGTGIWAMDFASDFPSADVTGTDLSPMQPTWVPPNLRFEVDDCLLDWMYPENHFDFIHVRAMYGSIPDWTDLDRKILYHLKPGGYLEHLEIGCQGMSDHKELPKDHIFYTWANTFYAAGEKMGRPFTICLDGESRKHMEEAGFANIQETRLKLPVGGWPKDPTLKQAGIYFQAALERDMEGFSMFVCTELLGWSKEEVHVLVAKMRQAIRDRASCPYIVVNIVVGQKPL
ncbi:S-adenosyl-L-methionine-dependent methyltransferase [Stachybotrys elegans]|uniref:S-adenosyl-L-methionine-dependent methyltransferase n=1 Tax=Stachybotrys elegans TaxID=80388 RepID=A0A8K0WWT7_9HYPO|nr:S-adenosyl-L-methionine-dependent methyltransferase [Stachybotrys elegans]